MTTKHTPGPWTVGPHPNMRDGIHVGIKGSPNIVVAWMDFWRNVECADEKPLEEQEANARLIAAAPELFKALKNCLAYMESDSDDHQEREDYAQAKAALAKAQPS